MTLRFRMASTAASWLIRTISVPDDGWIKQQFAVVCGLLVLVLVRCRSKTPPPLSENNKRLPREGTENCKARER